MVTLTQVLSGLFSAYIFYSIWSLYVLYAPSDCIPSKDVSCIKSYLQRQPFMKLTVYTSSNERFTKSSSKLWTSRPITGHEEFEETVDVEIPESVRSNGTMYALVTLNEVEDGTTSSKPWTVKKMTRLTTFMVPKATTFNLMGNDSTTKTKNASTIPETHWNSQLLINIVNDKLSINRYGVPHEIVSFITLHNKDEYLPILYLDELSIRMKDLIPLDPLNSTASNMMPLKIVYKPMSMGKLRFWTNMHHSMAALYKMGFSEKDIDEVKNIFVDINLYLLLLTFFVSAFHLLFDFLAFKNDINFWRSRENMVGLSTRTMVWRCFSTFIIFLYLMDQQTSLLVLIPSGIGLLIEIWKMMKAFRVKIVWTRLLVPSFQLGHSEKNEEETAMFDAQAMKWLLYVLYPLVLCGAVYSLLYTPHKSWYSWTIESMANGVYAFGFIFMLPQLFINYKLKSVAHLPWKAFTYKAFNTFIDDIFAFIITMPTSHRLACFRDDVVFVVYLYQRWLYPVDKKRVNEFGQSFEAAGGDDDSGRQQQEKQNNRGGQTNDQKGKKLSKKED